METSRSAAHSLSNKAPLIVRIQGVHKHFRMIALSSFMRNHGYDPEVDQHTRIPAIWEKLSTLYNLESIDERENYENDEDQFLDFDLPSEYAHEQFERGRRRTSSPPTSQAATSPAHFNPSPSPPRKRTRRDTTGVTRKRGSTVDDTDEPRTSPPTSPTSKPTRRGRAATRSGGGGRTRAESSSRAPSKDDTAQEDEEVEDSDEGEEEEDDGDEGSVTASERQSRGRGRASNTTTRKSKRKR